MGVYWPMRSFHLIHNWVWTSLKLNWSARQLYMEVWSLIFAKWWCNVQAMCNPFNSRPKWMKLDFMERLDKGNKFDVQNFFIRTWNMENFEVEVWKFQHVEKFTKCQAIYFNILPCLTFYVSFKWEKCLHQSCISLNTLKMVTNFMSFGFRMIELCIFEVWKNHLFNGVGKK